MLSYDKLSISHKREACMLTLNVYVVKYKFQFQAKMGIARDMKIDMVALVIEDHK